MANIWDDLEKQALAAAKPEENVWDRLEQEALGLGPKAKTGFVSDIKRGTGQIISGVGSSLRDLGAEDTGAAIEAYGEGVQRRNPSQINSFQDVLDKPFTTGREAVGEVLPQVAGVVGGQVAGRVIGGALGIPFGPAGVAVGQQVGGFAGSLLTAGATTYGGIRSEQRETGQNDIGRAIATAIPATALERFAGAERIAGKVVGKGTNFLARETGESFTGNLIRQGLRGGIEETLTEIPQTALERVGAFKDVTSPEAFDEYGVAGAKAFMGGGAVRAGLSSVAGVRDTTSGAGLAGTSDSPDNSAIKGAIDSTTQTIPVGPPPQSATMGPNLPETVGPQLPLAQQQAIQQAQQQVQQQQALQAQAAAAQEQLNVARKEVFTKYGGVETTIPNGTKPMWVYQGKNYFTEEALGKALDAQVKKETEKAPLVRAVETALTKTYEAVGIKPYSPGKMASFLAPFTDQAESLEEVANRIEAQLGTIKPNTPESDTLTALRNVILGKDINEPFGDANPKVEETKATKPAAKTAAKPAATTAAAQAPSPVVDVTQQYLAEQGAQDGQLQVQTDAGIRAVSEQGGTAQASEGIAGDVRPNEVRPLGTGSNALLTDTQQDVGQGAERARIEPTTSGQPDAISDDRQEALTQVRKIFTELFGSDRDASIIMELQDDSNPQTQTEIAKKYGVNQSTVSRILKVLQSDTLGPRFFLAAKKLGYSKDEVASLIVAIEGQPDQDSDVELVDDRDINQEASDSILNTNADDVNPAFSDEANVSKLGNEEVFGDEDSGATRGGYQIVDSIAGTKSADASSTNKTASKYAKDKTNWKKYDDFELQNLIADEIVSDADLPSLVEEIKRREDKRIGVNNANEKRSTKSVPVGEKTTTRKRVRKQDAEKQEAPAEDLSLTTEERAANAWDKVTSQIKGAPLFQELTEAQQQNFIDFGPDNWTAADVNTELNKIVAEYGASFSRSKDAGSAPKINFAKLVNAESREPIVDSLVNNVKLTKEQAELIVDTEIDMEVDGFPFGLVRNRTVFDSFPGVQALKDKLSAAGLSNVLDSVDGYVLFSNAGVDGIHTIASTNTGSISLVGINANKLIEGANEAAFTLSHEVGHSIDEPAYGGIYSSQPEFNIRVTPDGKMPTSFMGSVMRELHELYRYDADFKFLEYPFGFSDLDGDAIRNEVFAQIFAAMLDPQFSAMAKTKAPQTYAFMEDVFNDLKTTTFQRLSQEGREAQAIRRGAAFSDNRGQRTENASPVREEGREKVSFSRGGNLAAMRQQTQTRINRMPKAYRGTVQKMYDFLTTKNLGDRALAAFAFTRDVTQRAVAAGLKSAQTYQRLYDARKQVLGSYSSRIESIIEDFNKLDSVLKGTGPNSVNRFIKDSTVEGKWGFQPDWLLKPIVVDQVMADRFNALEKASPKAAEIIKAVFKYNYDTNQAMKKSIMDSVTSEFDALIAQAKKDGDVIEEARLTKEKAKDLSEFATRLAIRNEKPYAALKRFGNIVVVGKSKAYMDAEDADNKAEIRKLQTDENHYVVRFAETNSEAQAIYRDMQGKFEYLTEPFDSADAENSVYGGSDLNGLFYRLRNLVEKDDLDDPVQRGMVRMLNSLHLKLLSEESVRQSENRRKNITGADDDMMRAFVTQGRAAAHFVSSLTNSAGIYDSMREMRKERDARTPGKDVRSIYYNEIMKRHGMELNYDPTPIADAALNITSTWMLLTSPGYFFQNATQPFLLSLPYMGANPKFGYSRTAAELLKSYGEVKNVIGVGKKGLSEADYKDLPADVRAAIEELVKRGSINISLSAELGRFRSDTGENQDYVDKGQALLTKGTDMLRGFAENLESINRLTTAMTAYRMALKSGMSNDAAVDYADKVIYHTHGDYAGGNAPRFMRTPVGRVATQFRKFQLIQISLLARMWHQWRQSASPEERIVARRQLMFTLGHTFAIGGMMGMPGFTALAFLFGALFGDEDEPDNPELTLRKLIGDKDLADLLLQGVPAFMGVNLSGKLGMGQMLSVLPYTDLKFTRDSLFEATAALAGGPFVGGVLPRAINGASYMASGDYYKGLEQLMPKGIGDAMKGLRYGTEGVTNKRGDLMLSPDEISFMDAFLTGLGLPTKTITDRQMLESSKFKFDEFYNGKTTELKNAYAKAYRGNDTEAMADVRAKWKEIQESRQKNGYSRQPLSTLLKAPMEQRKRERMTAGGVGYNKGNRRFVQQNSEV